VNQVRDELPKCGCFYGFIHLSIILFAIIVAIILVSQFPSWWVFLGTMSVVLGITLVPVKVCEMRHALQLDVWLLVLLEAEWFLQEPKFEQLRLSALRARDLRSWKHLLDDLNDAIV
jgi:hypothetical protein